MAYTVPDHQPASLSRNRLNSLISSSTNALMAGAVGNAIADDTLSLRAYAVAVAAAGGVFQLPPGYSFSVSDTVTVPVGASGIEGRGAQILYTGPTDRPALVYGESGVSNQNAAGRQVRVRFPEVRYKINPSASELGNTNFVGIRTWNLRGCKVDVPYVMGFTRGIEFVSDQSLGSTYLKVNLGRIVNCFQSIVPRTAGPTPGGFTTQMNFYGGSLINNGSYPTTLGASGLFVTYERPSGSNPTGSNRQADAIVFHGTAFELGEHGGAGDRIPVVFDGAGHNCKFNDVRMEGCDGPFMKCDGAATLPNQDVYVTNNQVSFTTYSGAKQWSNPIYEINRAVGSRVINNLTVDSAFGGVLQPRHPASCVKAGGASAEKCLTGEWFYVSNGSPTPRKTFADAQVTLRPDYVELAEIGSSIALGVVIDTSVRKSFVVKSNCKTGYEGRILIIGYDRYGKQATSSGTGEDLLPAFWNFLNSQAATTFPYSSGFGGSHRNATKALGNTAQSFRVASTVASVFVGVSNNPNGDGPVRLCGIDILVPPIGSRDGADSTGFSPAFGDANAPPVSTAKPNNGGSTYGVTYPGEITLNANAATGGTQPAGWVTIGGTRTAPAWVGSTAYTLDAMSAANGNVYMVTTPGTSASAGGPSGTGTSISDGSNGLVWTYIATAATYAALANIS